jgi:hypothetical protein
MSPDGDVGYGLAGRRMGVRVSFILASGSGGKDVDVIGGLPYHDDYRRCL